MKSALVRTGSVPAFSPAGPGSPSLPKYKPFSGVFSGQKSGFPSPKISLHFEINQPRGAKSSYIRRAFSESDIARSLTGAGSWSFPSRIPEEEHLNDSRDELMIQEDENGFEISNYSGGASIDDLGFSGRGGSSDRSKIGAYYREMLNVNPGDSLLLRNYGKFLHEVENDAVRAEEYYGRAILASPGDGELLSLYGKLVWETERDEQRAKSYFDRAVHASPDDCSVLGSYAHFLWEVEADEEEEEDVEKTDGISPALVAAF